MKASTAQSRYRELLQSSGAFGGEIATTRSRLTAQGNWESYSLPQLKEFARRFGFTFPSKISKPDLVAFLDMKISRR